MTLLIVIECNLIGIKRDFFFFDHELSHSVVCNFSEHSMFELFETSNEITSKRSNRHLKIDNASCFVLISIPKSIPKRRNYGRLAL